MSGKRKVLNNLNDDQFHIPVRKLMRMKSVDAIARQDLGRVKSDTVGAAMKRKKHELLTMNPHHYFRIMDSMRAHGQQEPVYITSDNGQDYLANGLVRSIVAKDLGWKKIRATREMDPFSAFEE